MAYASDQDNLNAGRLAAPGVYCSGPVYTGVQFYNGAIVMANSSGYLIPGATTASSVPLGLCRSAMTPPSGVGTAGASGTYRIDYEPWAAVGFLEVNAYGGSITETDWLGKLVYVYDDATACLYATSSANLLGKCVQVLSTGTTSRIKVDCQNRVA